MTNKSYDKSIQICDKRMIQFSRYDCTGGNGYSENDNEINFFLFDYYDKLSYYRGEGENSLNYKDCFGLNTIRNMDEVASQLWTLVGMADDNGCPTLSDNPQEDDPFEYKSDAKNPTSLSDKPFISIINVTLHPSCYNIINNLKDENGKKRELNEREFILGCIAEIENRINHAKNFETKHIDANESIIKIFSSINYGDFCVVVRSRNLKDVFATSYAIRELPKNGSMPDSQLFKKFKFHTITAVGMEVKKNKDGMPLCVNIDKHTEYKDDLLVLRLQVKHNAINGLIELSDKIQEAYKPKIFKGEIPKGSGKTKIISIVKAGTNGKNTSIPYALVGRYDVSFRLNFEQFNLLYPAICFSKINVGEEAAIKKRLDELKKECADDLEKRLVYIIYKGIYSKEITIVNERLLIKLDEINIDEIEPVENKKDPFEEAFKILIDDISLLEKRAYELPYEKYKFKEQIRLVRGICSTFLTMWRQEDSKINAGLIHSIITILVDMIKMYLFKINSLSKNEDELHRKALCESLVTSLNDAIYYTNNYAKMIQAVNIRTFQKPNYEIETVVDNEKYAIALTEYSRILMKTYFCSKDVGSKEYKDNNYRFFPYIMLDLKSENVYARNLFDEVNRFLTKEDLADKRLTNILPITIPNYVYFARAYDLIPLLCHEISHSFRFCDKDTRNNQIINMVFKKISDYMATAWLVINNPNRDFALIDPLNSLLSEAIFESLYREYMKNKYKPSVSLSKLERDMKKHFVQNIFIVRDQPKSAINPNKPHYNILMNACNYIYVQAIKCEADNDMHINAIKYFDENIIDSEKINLHEDGQDGCKGNYKETEKHLFRLADSAKLMSLNTKIKWRLDYIHDIETITNIIDKMHEKEKRDDLIKSIEAFLANIKSIIEKIRKGVKPFIYVHKTAKDDYSEFCIRFYKETCKKIENLKKILEDKKFIELHEKISKRAKIFDEYTNIYELLEELIENLESTFISNINDTKSQIESAINDCTDVLIHTKCALDVISNSKNKILKKGSEEIRDKFLEDTKRHITKLYTTEDTYCKKGSMLRSNEVFPMLTSICFNAEDSNLFEKGLRSCLRSFDTLKIESIIEGTIHYYREVVADLSMCSLLNLTPFGYLIFTSKYHYIQKGDVEDKAKTLTAERMGAVMAVLLKEYININKRNICKADNGIQAETGDNADNGTEVETADNAENNKKIMMDAIIKGNKNCTESLKQYTTNLFENIIKRVTERKKYKIANKGVLKTTIEKLNNYRDILMYEIDCAIEKEPEEFLYDEKAAKRGKEIEKKKEEIEKKERDRYKSINELKDDLNLIFTVKDQTEGDINCGIDILNEFIEPFERLRFTVAMFKEIQIDINYIVNRNDKLYEHFCNLYNNEMIGSYDEKHCVWEGEDEHLEFRHDVGHYINNEDPFKFYFIPGEFTPENMLSKTFSFILKYYYKSRLDMGKKEEYGEARVRELVGDIDA